ncbi:hypothetical protein [Pedobacter borealis]|uniref:hypothetical protein n=1 Tax=Pedobacter borealis TaxID=475254 RepID=UPI001428AADA|nr:hypothetical protein [Pedobacter borealis]
MRFNNRTQVNGIFYLNRVLLDSYGMAGTSPYHYQEIDLTKSIDKVTGIKKTAVLVNITVVKPKALCYFSTIIKRAYYK